MTVHFTSQFVMIPLKCLETLCLRMLITMSIIAWERIQKKNTQMQLSKKHGLPFLTTAQTALNVGITVCCMECCKPRLIYSKSELKLNETEKLKRSLNGFHCICGSSFQEIALEELELLKKFSCEKTSPVRVKWSNLIIPAKSLKQCVFNAGNQAVYQMMV